MLIYKGSYVTLKALFVNLKFLEQNMRIWNHNKKVGLPLNKFLGNTNTSNEVSEFLVNAFIDFSKVSQKTLFLEPSVGTGSFYFALMDQLLSLKFPVKTIAEDMLYAFDVDLSAIAYVKKKLQKDYNYTVNKETKIFNKDFLAHDFKGTQFDYVVTNPPYISNKNIRFDDALYVNKADYLGTLQRLIDPNISNMADIYVYFYIKSFQLLKNGGQSIFLCSDSWIDGRFGDVIKSYLFSKDKSKPFFNLDIVLSSQLHPFFRDDTNAILTVISKNTTNKTTKIIPLKTSLEDMDPASLNFFEISSTEMESLLTTKEIVNRRNAIILFYEKFFEVNKFFIQQKDKFITVEDAYDVSTASLSQATMLKENMLLETSHSDDKETTPVFWQIQSRINRIPDYKNHIEKDSLAFGLNVENVPDKYLGNVVEDNLYMSTIIDRLPLLFYVEGESFHVSKYFSIKSKRKVSPAESVFYLNNVFTLLDMEIALKEGTRKTLRKGECGLAKEVKASDLNKVRIPANLDFGRVRDEMKCFSEKVIFSVEVALQDPDYMTIQRSIASQLGLESELMFVIENLIFLYVTRMRNIEKIENFKEYFEKTYGGLFKS